MEVLKENLAKEVLKKLKEISELWDISSKKWKKLPDNEKQLFYKKEYQIRTDISNMILGAFPGMDFFSVGKNGSWGIYNDKVDDDCRLAFGMIQNIRHQFWLKNPNSSSYTVDANIDDKYKGLITIEL